MMVSTTMTRADIKASSSKPRFTRPVSWSMSVVFRDANRGVAAIIPCQLLKRRLDQRSIPEVQGQRDVLAQVFILGIGRRREDSIHLHDFFRPAGEPGAVEIVNCVACADGAQAIDACGLASQVLENRFLLRTGQLLESLDVLAQ